MIKVKNLVLGIGIIVVFALALWQGIEAFYPSPQYENFCDEARAVKLIETQEQCIAEGGKWTQQDIRCITEPCPQGYCDADFTCRTDYDKARDDHSKIVFIISIIVALITLLVGYSILSVEPVGSALMGSAVWAIFYGTLINWRNFTDIWRFLLLFLALVLLIWIAYRLNTQKKKSFWQKLGFRK